jgi:formylmethanofuran dehydrogenase subunit A
MHLEGRSTVAGELDLSGHATGCQIDVKKILRTNDVDTSLADMGVPE